MIGKFKKSLRLKWLVFSVLLATIPLIIAGISIVQIYQKDLKKSVIEMEEAKANLVVEATQAFLEKVISNLLFLTKAENFGKNGFSHLRNHLENLLYQNDYFVELTLLDEKGREVVKVSKYKTVFPSHLKDLSKTEMFQVTSKGQIYYGGVLASAEEIPSMIIAIPIEAYKGKAIGVLAGQIHLQCLWDVVSKTKIGEKGIAYVVDWEGDLIAHPDARRVWMRENVSYLCGTRCHIQKESVFEWGWPSGERFLNIYKRIQNLGWGVFVEVPVEEAYQPVRKIAGTAIGWILIALSIAVLFTFFLTRKLTLPIKRLSEKMAEVARGNFETDIQVTTQDEIGLLANCFNRMVQGLRQSREALIEAETKYRRIFENSKDMIYITSVDGKFLEVNQAGVEMLGYATKKDLMNVHIKDIYLYPEDRKKFQNEVTQKGFVKDFEAKLKRKDGSPIDCLITASIRREEEGIITGYEGIIKDISFRKSAEKELLQKTEQLQTLYDLSILINQSLDLEKILPLALDKALKVTGFEMGTIHLLNDDGKSLDLKSYSGFSPVFIEHVKVLRWGEGVAGKAVDLRQPVTASIENYPSSRILPFLKEEGVRLTVGVPLVSKRKAIGAITLSSRSSRTLNPKEINLLESLGGQTGLALENARLFSHVAKAKSEWEATFDAVTDLITIRDKDYRIIRANRAAFQRYGLTPEQMIGKKCFEILHQRDQPCEGCYIAETLKTQKPVSGERESFDLKGTFRYYTFPIFNEAGAILAVVDLAREVTEEKRREMEKEVLNSINRIMASSLDVRDVIKAIHSELKKVLGSERMTITLLSDGGNQFRYFALEKDYEVQELLSSEAYPKEGAPLAKAVETGQAVLVSDTQASDSWVNRKLFREGIRSSLVFPLKCKDRVIGTINFGSRKPGHFSEDHVRFLGQVSVGLAISIENALLLDEIKASEERYRTVVESAMDGICVIGVDGRFSYVNETFANILGYARGELIGMDYRNCLDEEGKQLFSERNRRRERGEKVPRFLEFNVLRKDGEVRNVECSTRAVRHSDRSVSFIVIIKDITEKKKMEEQLVQSEKLRALGEMASGVAHDFNNALTAILGNTQLLLYTAKGEDAKETMQTIEKVAKDSARTVRRLQDFTRKSSHQEFFRIDLNSVVQDAIEITRPKWKDDAQGKGFQIEMVSTFEKIPAVGGNASELREVITNLIFNGIEAMPEGGKIEIRTYTRGEKVCIQVADTGIGMTEEVKRKAFEPFFTTKPFTNTGLGLSMSYGIIKKFGGEIDVESKVGQGTTFTITLPIGGEGKEELAVSSSPIVRATREARILVIDDEASVREVLSRILSQVNHQVTVAKDGGEGLQLFQEREFDIVLTDLGMPDMSGWDVCKAIKKLRACVPVGMITGWGMELDQTKKEESGLDFVIPKPFDFHQILRIVDETIASAEKRLLS